MTRMFYRVDDSAGKLVELVAERERAREQAQRLADLRGETLYLYPDGDNDYADDEFTGGRKEEFLPGPEFSCLDCGENGRGWHACQAYLSGDDEGGAQ